MPSFPPLPPPNWPAPSVDNAVPASAHARLQARARRQMMALTAKQDKGSPRGPLPGRFSPEAGESVVGVDHQALGSHRLGAGLAIDHGAKRHDNSGTWKWPGPVLVGCIERLRIAVIHRCLPSTAGHRLLSCLWKSAGCSLSDSKLHGLLEPLALFSSPGWKTPAPSQSGREQIHCSGHLNPLLKSSCTLF